MAKLKPLHIAIFFTCAGIFCLVLFLMHNQTANRSDSSIFGRNVYQQTTSIGQKADPNYVIKFPRDHLSHELFDIEWWYLTSNLEDQQGNVYGLQWTLFRFRNPSASEFAETQSVPWNNNQMYMAHASVHSKTEHWFSEKFARGLVGNAGVYAKPFRLMIDDWVWSNSESSDLLLPANLQFTAANTLSHDSLISADIELHQSGPMVLHGDSGYSQKSTSLHASHYYSAPFIDVTGELKVTQINNVLKTIKVTGQAWFDHEWTSELLDTSTLGWDWFSVHFDNGSKLMAFRMRLADTDDYVTGSFIDADGIQTTLLPSMISLEPTSTSLVRNKEMPLTWQLKVPNQAINIGISSVKNDQYNDAFVPYYEGMVDVTGSHSGRGFMELTGY
jgi:predicted secreted hydrolase